MKDELTVRVNAHVRYWEDSRINGTYDDATSPKMPCVSEDGEYWQPVIDVHNGHIDNWTDGIEAKIHYKVCDECGIVIADGETVIYDDMDYVPGFLCPEEEGYGDYIIMNIDDKGYIKLWDKDGVKEFLENL